MPLLPGVDGVNDAPEAEPEADGSDTHEVTVLDASGNMADIGSEAEGASRLVSEMSDTAPVSALHETSTADLPQDAVAEVGPQLADPPATPPANPKEVREHLRRLVDELIAEYNGPKSERGIEIREIAGGYRMATKPEYHDAVRAFVKNLKPAMKLSQQALETLAVIAYKQPVTSPEIGEIRGVDSGGVLANLISRKLVTTAGRKQVIGRPILYKTTKEFLLGFGLKDLSELPSMEEFEKMAGELAASDALEAEAMSERAGVPETAVAEAEVAEVEVPGSTESSRLAAPPEQSEAEPVTSVSSSTDDLERPDPIDEQVPQQQES
jgi:segregation and condensation protein B